MNIDQVKAAYQALQRPGRRIGRLAATLTAMALSAFPDPMLAGPTAIAVDKVGEAMFGIDAERHFAAIESALIQAAPKLAAIDDLEARVTALQELLGHDATVQAVARSVAAAAAAELDPLTFNNVGGVHRFEDLVVDNMRLTSTATQGGRTIFEGLTHTGPATFDTDRAEQVVRSAHFSGRTPGFSYSAAIPEALLGTGKVEVGVSTPNSMTALKITASSPGTAFTVGARTPRKPGRG